MGLRGPGRLRLGGGPRPGAALAAGLDLEMPPALGYSDVAVVEAVTAGTLDEAVLDEGVRRVLRLVLQAQPALTEGGSSRPR